MTLLEKINQLATNRMSVWNLNANKVFQVSTRITSKLKAVQAALIRKGLRICIHIKRSRWCSLKFLATWANFIKSISTMSTANES